VAYFSAALIARVRSNSCPSFAFSPDFEGEIGFYCGA
jgi:hypothetical protein